MERHCATKAQSSDHQWRTSANTYCFDEASLRHLSPAGGAPDARLTAGRRRGTLRYMTSDTRADRNCSCGAAPFRSVPGCRTDCGGPGGCGMPTNVSTPTPRGRFSVINPGTTAPGTTSSTVLDGVPGAWVD